MSSSRQPEAEPHPDNAPLKRKLGDDHESSRMERVERFSPQGQADALSGEDEPKHSPERDPISNWRAILSFHEMIRNPVSAAQIYTTLDAEQRLITALGVRNLFLATSAGKNGTVRDQDRQVLEHMQSVVEDVADPAVMSDSGLRVSFYPGSKYTKLRHIQDLDVKIGEHPHKDYFALLMKTPRVFAAFVEAHD
ncbi:hypothetical protein E4U54_006551 [Claviceps lovelessii]|nr:hypothetical protein E4U54_006551 [Claviceps lovelessii]